MVKQALDAVAESEEALIAALEAHRDLALAARWSAEQERE
jgi:hypothetical protein